MSNALDVPEAAITVTSIIQNQKRSVDVSVLYDVDLESSGYDTPDDLELEMTDIVDDPSSTLYEGNITSCIDPDTFEVVGVFFYSSSSSNIWSSSSSTTFSSSSFSHEPASDSTHPINSATQPVPVFFVVVVLTLQRFVNL